jgi:hypothetical protein
MQPHGPIPCLSGVRGHINGNNAPAGADCPYIDPFVFSLYKNIFGYFMHKNPMASVLLQWF